MSVHVAIVTRPYDRLILEGRKTVECRLTRRPIPPFGCITPGDRIYFKVSSGPFFAAAEVDRIWTTDSLTPSRVDELRKKYNSVIHGELAYWKQRRSCPHVTLIWLRDVRPCSARPHYRPQNMRAWYTLDDSAAPPEPTPNGEFEITLTDGALRNNYVIVTRHMSHFSSRHARGDELTLLLDNGPTVETDIYKSSSTARIRWRGWGPWFTQCGLRAGDRLRFTPVGKRAYKVQPIRKSRR